MKKRCGYLMQLLLAVFLFMMSYQRVNAESVEGMYKYEVTDGKVTITEYTGNEENVSIPDTIGGNTVTRIGNGAFSAKTQIKTISFPNGLTRIEPYAFEQCESLQKVKFPEGLTNIRYHAFDGCKKLDYIEFPATLESLGDNVFVGCNNIETINVSSDNRHFVSKNNVLLSKDEGKLYLYASALQQKVYAVPQTITVIGAGAFTDAMNLEKVYISNENTTFKDGAFSKINQKITICGKTGSTAETYANANQITFKEETYIPVEYLTVPEKNIYITDKNNMIVPLSVTIVPTNASESVIRWTSNNESVATVKDGIVTVKSNGITVITAHCEDESITCNIWVDISEDPKPTPGGDDNQNGGNDNQNPGNNGNNNGSQDGNNNQNNGNQNGNNNSGNNDNQNGNNNQNNGSSGNQNSDGNASQNYNVSFSSQTYQVYATGKVTAALSSNMAGDGFVSIQSSNTAVATVANDGTITGVKAGTAVITATTKSGKTITATVNVATPAVKLNATSAPLQLKKSTTALKVKSKLDTDSILQWTSSKPKVATVNKKTGKITAKKTGTTYITVIMKSGATAKCKIKVQKKAVKTTKLTLNAKAKTLKLKGGSKTFQLSVTKTPITSLEKVTYKSSNKRIATVSGKGKITAKRAGKATITVKAGKKTAKIKITVKKK